MKTIKSDGTVETLQDGNLFSDVQKIVGGFVQIIHFENGQSMAVNEDGKSEGLPVNVKATIIAKPFISGSDFIVGDAVIFEKGELLE